jgi:amino acid transporter
VKPLEADLVWERPEIDRYESEILTPQTTFWGEMVDMLRLKKRQ